MTFLVNEVKISREYDLLKMEVGRGRKGKERLVVIDRVYKIFEKSSKGVRTT